MPKGDSIGNYFIGKNTPTVDVVEENLLGKITQDDDGGLVFEDINLDENIILSNSDVSSFKNCSLQYGSGICFYNCKNLVINEENTPFFFDGSINWTIPYNKLALSCKRVEKNPLKKISYRGGYDFFFGGTEISGKVINDFSPFNIEAGNCGNLFDSSILYNENESNDYTIYLPPSINSYHGMCNNTKTKNGQPFNINFWSNGVNENSSCSYLFSNSTLGMDVKIDYDEPTTLFHKKTETIQREEYPGIIWHGFEENIENADGMYSGVKTLQCEEFHKKNNNPLIHYLWPPNAASYENIFSDSNISGSTIFVDKNGKEHYLRVLSDASSLDRRVLMSHSFDNVTKMQDYCFDGNGKNTVYIPSFSYMCVSSPIVKIGFRNFNVVYLVDERYSVPSREEFHVLIGKYDFGKKETEIYSDTFRYTGAENTLEYIKGKIYCSNRFGLVKADKLQNKITDYYIAPANTKMMKNYDFNWDLSCFPNLSKESIEFTFSNILPSQLPLSENATISYNKNTPIFKNKTLSTVYVKITDTSKDEKPIIFVESNVDGAITLQDYLITYKPHLIVNLIDFSN